MKSKINILYLVSTLEATGPTNQLSYIIKGLDLTVFNPIVLTLSKETTRSKKDLYTNVLKVKVASLELSRLQGLFFARKHVKNFIKEHNINIIHSQGIRADVIATSLKTPNVLTIRNYPYEDYPKLYGKYLGNFMAYKHIKAITKNKENSYACSYTVAEKFKAKIPDFKAVQNGVDTSIYKKRSITNEEKEAKRTELGLPLDKKIITIVGPLISRKNNLQFIEAFNINKENKKYTLLFLGDGPEKEKLQEAVKNTNVIFKGNVTNVKDYLQASDILASASLSEGLPNSVLEAMACGLPTYLSNIPSHKELYFNTEDKAMFFEVNTSKINLSSLEELDKNLQEYSNLSLQQIALYFDSKMMSNKYQTIYKKIVL